MGGGPGFTVHQMGGGIPRRRPRTGDEPAPSGLSALTQLLPLLLLFLLPLLTSFFNGTTSTGPSVRYDSPSPPMTMHRITSRYKVDYWVNPVEVEGWKANKMLSLDQRVETDYITHLRYRCESETHQKRQEIQDATGFFFTDEDRLRKARAMPMPGCRRLDEMRISRQSY